MRGTRRAAFAAILLLIAGTLNSVSNRYGRVIGMTAGSVGAIGALLSIGSADPAWSLAISALCIYVAHGIVTFGQGERALAT